MSTSSVGWPGLGVLPTPAGPFLLTPVFSHILLPKSRHVRAFLLKFLYEADEERQVSNLLKLPEVAQRLNVSEKTVRRYVKAGVLPSSFIGNAYRVSEEDVEEYLRRARVEIGDGSPKASHSSAEPPEESEEERLENLRLTREVLADAHDLLAEWAKEYGAAGDTDKLRTLASVAMFSVMGAEQFVEAEVGPAEDRASQRVYTAGARLEEFVEDLLETIQSTTTESGGGELAYLDAHRRRRAS